MLMLSEHRVLSRTRRCAAYFIVCKQKYLIADPSVSDGCLLAVDVLDATQSSVRLIHELVCKHLQIRKMKERKYILMDIVLYAPKICKLFLQKISISVSDEWL